jgi:hypothetical protein
MITLLQVRVNKASVHVLGFRRLKEDPTPRHSTSSPRRHSTPTAFTTSCTRTELQLSLFVSNFNFYSIYPLYPRTGNVIAQTAAKSRVATATDLPISFTFPN